MGREDYLSSSNTHQNVCQVGLSSNPDIQRDKKRSSFVYTINRQSIAHQPQERKQATTTIYVYGLYKNIDMAKTS